MFFLLVIFCLFSLFLLVFVFPIACLHSCLFVDFSKTMQCLCFPVTSDISVSLFESLIILEPALKNIYHVLFGQFSLVFGIIF